MKVAFKKVCTLRLFGFKLLKFESEYIEHSSDKDSNDDEFYIDLTTRTIGKDK